MKQTGYFFHVFVAVALLAVGYSAAGATMYKCFDASGGVIFTDMKTSSDCAPVVFQQRETVFERGSGRFRGSIELQRLASKYDNYIQYYGVRYNIDPHLIRAIIRTESGFNPRAVSSKGAQGLMQLMPATARELRVGNPFDPEENISGGTRYLRSLLDSFKQDVRLALAAYNAGPTIVRKEQNVPRIPETVQYVKRVLNYYRQYKDGTS